MHIGLEIKELARKENITLAELAKRINRNKQSVYEMVEKEDINTGLLRKVAKALNVPMAHFFSDDPLAETKTVVGSSNIVTGDNINSNVGNCPNPMESSEVLKGQIALLNERIQEKDTQIQEKDAQIRQLLEILKTK